MAMDLRHQKYHLYRSHTERDCGAGPDLSDWLCLAVGYLSLACVAFTAAWLVVSWKVVWQQWRPRLLAQHSLLHLMHRLSQDVWTKLITSAGQKKRVSDSAAL